MAVNKIGALAILFCGMILLGGNVEVKAIRPSFEAIRLGLDKACPRNCFFIEYMICDGEKIVTDCTNCCVAEGCTVYFGDGISHYCTWPPAKM